MTYKIMKINCPFWGIFFAFTCHVLCSGMEDDGQGLVSGRILTLQEVQKDLARYQEITANLVPSDSAAVMIVYVEEMQRVAERIIAAKAEGGSAAVEAEEELCLQLHLKFKRRVDPVLDRAGVKRKRKKICRGWCIVS